MRSFIPAISRSAKCLLILMLAFLPIGCAATPQLTLTSVDHNQSYRQGFTQADDDGAMRLLGELARFKE